MIRWLGKVSAMIVGLVILLAIAGASYQATESRLDAQRFPQIGKSVDVGGYKLNLNCTGQGSPTVILDSGLGGLALSWQGVQGEVEKFTRVCTYDRGGYGWSDPGPMPRTSAQIVKELHTLLQNSGEKPPYILVGHSSGGFNVRVYNGQYPDDVVGMVLVDASHEDQVRESPANIRKWWENSSKEFQRQMEFRALAIWFGVAGFASRKQTQEFAHLDLHPKFVYAMRSESENFEESAQRSESCWNSRR
jgi:pimeloyl-ACP methyl ester carboxylesterase